MLINSGFSKIEIKFPELNIGMMGYGHPENIAKSQATPIYSRTLVLKDHKNKIIVLNVVELCFISMALKNAVVEEMKNLFPELYWGHDNILLSAQHTHSAPGGYSHYPMWNFTIPGFRPKTFDAIKTAIVSSVSMALKSLAPTIVSYGEIEIDAKIPLAFNRSISAIKNNPEYLQNIFDPANPIDRTMKVLLFQNEKKENIGCINLFGVHCTSIPNRNTAIHSDNKGVAAALWEKKFLSSVALFAQATAGDVSPNYIFDSKFKENRGPSTDGIKNAEINGAYQFEISQKIISKEVHIEITSTFHAFKDFAKNCCSPAHGVAFAEGTLDGLGIPKWVGTILKKYLKVFQWFQSLKSNHENFIKHQSPKAIFLDHRQGKFFGISYKIFKYLKFLPDPLLCEIGKQVTSGSLDTHPWVPSHLPLQLMNLGNIVIIGVPGEITTVAGLRLKNSLEKFFPESTLLLWSYCNAFMGYITTPEEYDEQCYEGGHTIYGRNTLPYLISCFEKLAQGELVEDKPPTFSEQELKKRSY